MKLKVYAMEDDLRGSEIRFVGVCSDIESAVRDEKELETNNSLNEWVTNCIRCNFPPIIHELDEADSVADAEHKRDYWIKTFRDRGHSLFNKGDE